LYGASTPSLLFDFLLSDFLKTKWRTIANHSLQGFLSLLIQNLLSDFYKTKWGIQNGGRFVQKPAKMLIKVSL